MISEPSSAKQVWIRSEQEKGQGTGREEVGAAGRGRRERHVGLTTASTHSVSEPAVISKNCRSSCTQQKHVCR